MKTTHTNRSTKFIELLSIEDMHSNSKEWLSELNFIKDEQLFLEDLIKSFTLQLIELQDFTKNKKIIDAISDSSKENEALLKVVKKHESKLEALVDGTNQLQKEKLYKEKHTDLTLTIHQFLTDYKLLKLAFFKVIKKIKKTQKQKRLLN